MCSGVVSCFGADMGFGVVVVAGTRHCFRDSADGAMDCLVQFLQLQGSYSHFHFHLYFLHFHYYYYCFLCRFHSARWTPILMIRLKLKSRIERRVVVLFQRDSAGWKRRRCLDRTF